MSKSAKETSTSRTRRDNSSGEWMVISRAKRGGGKFTSFGAVSVSSSHTPDEIIQKNIQAGQMALKRAAETLEGHGVKLKSVKGVPLFWADSDNPEVFVRELDDKVERGHFIDGRFVPFEH